MRSKLSFKKLLVVRFIQFVNLLTKGRKRAEFKNLVELMSFFYFYFIFFHFNCIQSNLEGKLKI